jgi:outer membrane protein TolC
MRPGLTRIWTVYAIAALAADAQSAISLKEAVHLALQKNSAISAADAAASAAESRIHESRAAFLPKVNYSESWARSDNPVFVFSSLLTQHQFGSENFELGALNRPGFLNNFQSLLTADQVIYDAGQSKRSVRAAELSRDMTKESGRLTQLEVIANVVRAYFDAVLSAAQLGVAINAVRSGEADLERAQTIRAAGMSTDADVLSIRVHLASVEEQKIRRGADLDVARAALNDALGIALETEHSLSTALTRANVSDLSLEEYESTSLKERGEARQARLAVGLAENQSALARSALLPQVSIHGAFEADRQRFYELGGTSWTISAGLKWNLFNGNADKARIEETRALLKRSQAEQERAGSAIRLQVRRAYAELRAAEQRIEVAKASVEEAEESLRVLQNRYAAGMSNVTELLRTETAALEARTRYQAALHDQRIAAMMLEMAAGTLNANSEVLN